MLFDTSAIPWVLGDEILVVVHPLDELLLGQIVQVAGETEGLWDGGAEVATALLHDRQLCLPDHLVVIHDRVIQGELAVRDHFQDPVHLLFRHPAFHEGEVGPETSAAVESCFRSQEAHTSKFQEQPMSLPYAGGQV